MSKNVVAVIESIRGKYIAIDEKGNVRVLKKGDVVYENEEVRFDGKQPSSSLQEDGLSFNDITSGDYPYLLINHVKSGTTHLISYTEYIYFDSDISGSDNATGSNNTTTNRLANINDDSSAGSSSRSDGALYTEDTTLTSSQSEASLHVDNESSSDIMQTINEILQTPQLSTDTEQTTQTDEAQKILEDDSEDDVSPTIQPNVPPTIVGSEFGGSVKEIADLDPKENSTKVTTNGTIAFLDENPSDTHTVTSTPKESNYKGEFTAKIENGEIVWDFKVDDKDLDTLKEGETLTQTYTVTLDDGNGGTITKDVVVSIEGTNDAPIAQDDTNDTDIDNPSNGNVLANDSDIDGDTLHVSQVNGNPIGSPITTTYGTITVQEDGSYTYTPNPENDNLKALSGTESLDDVITYTVDDGNGGTATKTLTITVTGTNDTPIIDDGDLTGSVKEITDLDPSENNTTLTTNGKIPFTDHDTSDTHTVTSTPKESNYKGEFTAKIENGEIVWDFKVDDKDLDTLKEGETLTQTYTVTLDDGNGGTITKDVVVSIEGTNDAPIAEDDTVETPEDTPVSGNLMGNDSDIDDDTLHVSKFTIDGISGDQPIGQDVVIPGKGTINIKADGSYTFTPDSNYHGSIPKITYTLQDDKGGEDTAVLDITVGSINDNPVANNDINTINEDEVASGDLLANDTDIDHNYLNVTSFSINGTTFTPSDTAVDVIENGKVVGKLKITEDGKYEFTPTKDFNGDVPSVTYHISDGHGGTSLANLNIHVNPINDAPVANPDTKTIIEDTQAQGNVIESNDTDVDGDTLHVVNAKVDINGDGNLQDITIGTPIALSKDGKAIGVFEIKDDGSYTFNPAQDYDGDVPQIVYTISDGNLTDTSTLDIDITPVEEPPTANKDIKTVAEDSTLNGNVLSNDTDPDGNDTIKVKSATVDINGDGNEQPLPIGTATTLTKNGVNIGVITLNEDGTFSFTPETNYDGEVPTVNYTIEDDTGKTSSSTLDINIDSQNDAPQAYPDSKTVIEDTKATGNILINDVDIDGDSLYVKSAKVDIDGDGTKEDITIGDAIAISNSSGEAIGTFKLDPDGTYTFDPAPDYVGDIPVVDYTATDGEFDTSSTLTLNIQSINDAPTPHPDKQTIPEDTTATGNVLTNDEDVENDTLHVKSATVDINGDGSQESLTIGTETSLSKDGKVIGKITLKANGEYTFTPADDYNGDVPQVTYTATDGENDVNSTLDIDITPTDDGVTISGLNSTAQHTLNEANLTNGSVPNTSDLSKTGSFSFTSVDGFGKISIHGHDFTLADIEAFDGSGSIDTDYGTLTFNSFVGDTYGGKINYTYTLTKNVDNDTAGATPTNYMEKLDITVTDKDTGVATSFLNIEILDDTPTAVADTNSITEDTVSINGNVITNDTKGADNATIQAQQTTGTYGTVKINADGTYIYTLDNANLAVQDLTTGESLTDTFTYTIKDSDGDTSTTTLTITINGADDGVELTLPTDNKVYESGLSDGSEAVTDKEIVSDSFTLKASDGLKDIEVGGTTLTKAQVEALSSTNTTTIDTTEGTLELNGYSKASDGTITINYTYTLKDNQTHPNANANNEIIDNISITVNDTDSTADTITQNLSITIVDDTPTAVADTNSITEDETSSTGNVLTSTNASTNDAIDTQGADTAQVSGVKAGNSTSSDAISNVGDDVTGTYGKVNINENGTYTYTLDNTNLEVQDLTTGESLTDTFTYTIKDNDGDTSTTTLTITINGADDGVELTLPTDNKVYESGLDDGSEASTTKEIVSDSFTLKASDGLKDIQVDGTTLTKAQVEALSTTSQTIDTTEGTLELNGYSKASDGTITINYTYTLKDNQTHPNANANNEIIDNISITVNDTDSTADTITQNLSITIVDDTPTAVADTTSISVKEGGNAYDSTVDTNLLKNDTLGADGATVTSITYKNESGVSVTGDVTQDNQFTTFDTIHGSLQVKSDGSWKFISDSSVDNTTNPATETFTYTITDGDGDTSSANQSINITDTNPTVTPTDGSVDEEGLSNGSSTSQSKTTTTQDLNIAKDHDDISDVVFTNATITTLNTLNLKSSGTVLAYTLSNSNHTLTAKAGSESVFTVELTNPTDSTGEDQAYKFTLLNPIDHPLGNDENTQNLTFNFDVSDTDSTVSSSFQVGIVDDVPTASSESALTVVEGQVALTGMVNLLDNDINGADGLKEANKIVGFKYNDTNGVEQTGTLGTQVDSQYGKLTVNADGSYSYTSNQSNDHTSSDTLTDTFTYIIEDYDGDKSEATQSINVTDGADPTIDSTNNTIVKVYEGDSKVTFNGTSNYNESSSNANKDTTSKLTHKLHFTQGTDKAGISEFTFDGQTKTIAEDGSATITSATKGVLTVHYDGTWEYTPPATHTHDSGNGVNYFQETFTYKVTDTDGDSVTTGSQTIQVDDTLASFGTIDSDTLDEKYLPTGTAPDNAQLTQTGNIGIDVSKLNGTHDVKFNTSQNDTTLNDGHEINSAETLSSLGQKISYNVSADGHTLTLYTGTDANATANHVMVVTILNPTGTNPTYSAKLLKPLDHKDALVDTVGDEKLLTFDIGITLSDDDGDTDGGTLTIKVQDDHAEINQSMELDEDSSKTITTNADATQTNTHINDDTSTDGSWVSTSHGQARVESNGKITYKPNDDYSGQDQFTYKTILDDGVTQQTVTVSVDVNPLAEHTLKTDVDGDNNADLTNEVIGTSKTTYDLATVYNDEDTTIDMKIPNFSELLKDTSTGKTIGGIETVGNVIISGIPTGAKITYGSTTLTQDGSGNFTLDLSTMTGSNNYLDYKIIGLPANSNTDFTITYSFTATDTATISSGDVNDTHNFEVTQEVDMLGVADIDGTKLDLTDTTEDENTAILLRDIITKTGLFIDNDGSETHTFVISGLPLDVTTSAGTLVTVTNAGVKTQTLTITEAQLSTATIKFPHSDGAFNIKVTAISQENDHNDTKGASPAKEDKDTQNVANVDNSTHNDGISYGQGYAQVSKNVTLTINPDAKDTVFNVANKETTEDTAIGLNIGFTNPDNQDSITNGNTVGTAESVTEVTISGIPDGAKLYETNGTTEILYTGTSHTFTISGSIDMDYIKGIQILPPAHSSKDFTLTLSAKVAEGTALNTITKTQIIKVTPVAELTTSNSDGANGNDITMAENKTYATHATEDTFFNIGNNDSFNLKDGWSNEDDTNATTTAGHTNTQTDSEETFAHLTFGTGSGTSFAPKAGATFTYSDGTTTHTLTDSGSGVDIPVAYLDTVQVKAPLNESGDFRVQVEAKSVDYDEDDGAKVEAISGKSFLDFTVDAEADEATVAVKPARGSEDAGWVNGNDTTTTPSTVNLNKAIDLHITPSSDDGSESFNVKIGDIPDGAVLAVWNGSSYVNIDKDTSTVPNQYEITQETGKWSIKLFDFDANHQPKFIPTHNDGTNVTLKVSAQTSDGGNTGNFSDPLYLNIKIRPIADKIVYDDFNKFDVNGDVNVSGKYNYVTTEADNDDTNNNKILLKNIYSTPGNIAPYDNDSAPAPEVVTFVVTGLDDRFDMAGASFLGGSGTDRQWVVTLKELQGDTVFITTQKDFAGEIDFTIDAVTTETEGDSEKHEEKTATIFVKPDANDGTLENLSVTQQEDAWVKLTFLDKFNDTDDDGAIDGEESLSSAWLKASDLTNLEISLDKNTIIDKTTLSTDGDGYYTQNFSNGVWVRVDSTQTTGTPLPHSDDNYSIDVKYEVTDEVKDGATVLDTATQTKTATYTVNVEAVTDEPTLTLNNSNTETINTENDEYSNGVLVNDHGDNTFTKTITINSPDNDGSESFTRLAITGVPVGIGIENGVYGGDTWYVDIYPDQAISSANVANPSYDLTFKIIGDFSNVTNTSITITAYNQDRVGGDVETSEESNSVTFGLTLQGGSDDGETTDLIDEFATTDVAIGEDITNGFTLQDVVDASFHSGKSAPFTFVLYDLPNDAEVDGSGLPSGATISKQGNVWVINGSNTNSIDSVLNNVKITMPPDYSTNDTTITDGGDGVLPFKIDFTAYGDGGKTERTGKESVNVTVKPITDPMDFDGTTSPITTDEDIPVDIEINFANEKDGTYQEIVDGKVYFQIDESHMTGTANGTLSYNGTTLTKTTLTAEQSPTGVAGDFYVATIADSDTDATNGITPPSSITVKYTPAEHEDGSVSIKTYVTHKETHDISGHDSTEQTSSMTHDITVNPAPDPLKIKATQTEVSAVEGNRVELPYTVSQIDEGDELASILVKNIPQDYIVYYYPDGSTTGVIANNIGADTNGNNSWSIPANSDGTSPTIKLKSPPNVSEVVENIELIAVTQDNLLSTPTTIKATFTPEADNVNLNPTATYGEEYTWINLNLNADMNDSDGSETLTLELSGSVPLDDTALFKIGDSYVIPDNISFSGGKYTITGIPEANVNDVKILYHDYDGRLDIKATTVDTLKDGGTTHTDTLATAVEKTMELKISDSFSINVSSETQDMTIMTEDLTIPIIGSDQTDTVVFTDTSSVSINFADIADDMTNIETIDITLGDVTLTNLSAQDIKNMTDNGDSLTIDGDNGDTINLTGWNMDTNGGGYTTYTNDGATLKVDEDINVLGIP